MPGETELPGPVETNPKRPRFARDITEQVARIVVAVRQFHEDVRDGLVHLRKADIVGRTARSTGISLTTVKKISKDGPESFRCDGEQLTYETRSQLYDPNHLKQIRICVNECYEEGILPTVDIVYEKTKQFFATSQNPIDCGTRTFYSMMKRAELHFGRGKDHYQVCREKPSIIRQASRYIRAVRLHRESGRERIYQDETWFNSNMGPGKMWVDESKNGGFKVTSGKGTRLIVSHLGSTKRGFVDEAELMYTGKAKTDDYHENMNAHVFQDWMKKVLPKIRGAVLILDQAPYHRVLTPATRPPKSNLKKADLIDWMLSHQDPRSREELQLITRAELMQEAKMRVPAPVYEIQELATPYDVEILWLPVAHPMMNPIELLWAQIKNDIRRKNRYFTIKQVKELGQAKIRSLGSDDWIACDLHAQQWEDKLYQQAEENFPDEDFSENDNDASGSGSEEE
jgi:transposase